MYATTVPLSTYSYPQIFQATFALLKLFSWTSASVIHVNHPTFVGLGKMLLSLNENLINQFRFSHFYFTMNAPMNNTEYFQQIRSMSRGNVILLELNYFLKINFGWVIGNFAPFLLSSYPPSDACSADSPFHGNADKFTIKFLIFAYRDVTRNRVITRKKPFTFPCIGCRIQRRIDRRGLRKTKNIHVSMIVIVLLGDVL